MLSPPSAKNESSTPTHRAEHLGEQTVERLLRCRLGARVTLRGHSKSGAGNPRSSLPWAESTGSTPTPPPTAPCARPTDAYERSTPASNPRRGHGTTYPTPLPPPSSARRTATAPATPTAATPNRSHPTRSGNHAPSPENRSAPHTPTHSRDIAPPHHITGPIHPRTRTPNGLATNRSAVNPDRA